MKLIAYRLIIFVLIAFILSCGEGGGATQAISNSTTANPISITRTLDTARTVSASIFPQGGILSVTSADGIVYTLTLPANAILSMKAISLTPLVSADLPFAGGMVAGVEIQPKGLQLLQAASLVISATPQTNANLITAYAYTGVGEDFFVYPYKNNSDSRSLEITHFSGYGLANSTAEEIERMKNHEPSAAVDQIMKTIAEFTWQQGIGIAEELTDEQATNILQALHFIWLTEIQPGLNEAKNAVSFELFKAAVQNFIAWLVKLDELNWISNDGVLLPNEQASGWQLVSEIVEKLQDKAFDRCQKQHDLEQISVMVALDKILHILPTEAKVSLVNDKLMQSCLQFEAEFSYAVNGKFSDLFDYSVSVTETYQLDFDTNIVSNGGVLDPFGVAVVNNVSITLHNSPGCNTQLGEFVYKGGRHYLLLDLDFSSEKGPQELMLASDKFGNGSFSHVGHNFNIVCKDSSGPAGASNIFEFDLPSQGDQYLFQGWHIEGGETYATWNSNRTYSGFHNVTGDRGELKGLGIKLRHTPQPLAN